MDIVQIIREAQKLRVSDIHIVCGLPIRIRKSGKLINYSNYILTAADCDDIASQLLNGASVPDCGEIDSAGTFDGDIRCRLNIFRQQGHTSCAIRILNDRIPSLDVLGLPEIVRTFTSYPRGIVIVTGETGSGKSTTLAALLNEINHTREEHIITLEDPIEYVYKPDRCTINQREIGTDTETFDTGFRAILREDPDVILVGEMRGLETIETALVAAETGHLVFATLHTNSASDTIDRIVNVFPGEKQQQIRLQLSMTLKAVVAQQLLPKKDGEGRVLACEVMVLNSAIKNLIREGKTPQIENSLATSAAEGNITMDASLAKLVRTGMITNETAIGAAHDPDFLRKILGLPAPTVPTASLGGNERMRLY